MTLGERLKRLRQEKNWTQAELADQLKIHQKQLSGYERDVHVPSTEVLMKIADLFNVSLDYLAFDKASENKRFQLGDRDLMVKFEEIDKLSEKDKTTIKAILDTFILKHRFQQLAMAQDNT